MICIPAETIVPLGDGNSLFAAQRIKIRVEDESSGPYLIVEGIDDEPVEGGNAHCFYLCTAKEIDEFAAICKRILKEAEMAGETK